MSGQKIIDALQAASDGKFARVQLSNGETWTKLSNGRPASLRRQVLLEAAALAEERMRWLAKNGGDTPFARARIQEAMQITIGLRKLARESDERS